MLRRFLYFSRLFNLIKDVEGDVVECGVGRGISLVQLAMLVKDEGKGRGVVAFDEYMGGRERIMFPGAKKAIDEYFGDAGSLIQRDPVADKYFLVKGVV